MAVGRRTFEQKRKRTESRFLFFVVTFFVFSQDLKWKKGKKKTVLALPLFYTSINMRLIRAGAGNELKDGLGHFTGQIRYIYTSAVYQQCTDAVKTRLKKKKKRTQMSDPTFRAIRFGFSLGLANVRIGTERKKITEQR